MEQFLIIQNQCWATGHVSYDPSQFSVQLICEAHAVKVDYVGIHTFRLRLFLMEYLHGIYD